MIRAIALLLGLAACTPQPTELPEDFDPSFAFFLPHNMSGD
ncbi:hypothetical protein [Roseobacter sp. CCS2]|nr:hypothetical protein [Roseobacter sp. CCS2]EBA11076.1 hypothetical protein RCCS2_01304 [Roseobacter sp. CCS2]